VDNRKEDFQASIIVVEVKLGGDFHARPQFILQHNTLILWNQLIKKFKVHGSTEGQGSYMKDG